VKQSKANVSVRDRILVSLGGLVSAPLCAYAVLFSGVFYNVNDAAVWFAVVLSLAACVACWPFLYYLFRGSMSVAGGRYHIPLAVTTVAGALSTALVFSCPAAPEALAGILFCIALPVSAVSMQVFLFLYGSIRSKIEGEDERRPRQFRAIAELAGVAALIVCIALSAHLIKAEADFIAACGQLAAVLFLAAGFCVYFGSVSFLPRYIRLIPPLKRTAFQKFKGFYAPVFAKAHALSRVAHCFFYAAAFMVLLSALMFPPVGVVLFLGAAALCYAAVAYFIEKLVSVRTVFRLSVAVGASIPVCAFLAALAAGLGNAPFFPYALFVLSGVILGCGGGIARAVQNYRMQEIELGTSASEGIVRIFFMLLSFVAFAAAALTVRLSAVFGGAIQQATAVFGGFEFIVFPTVFVLSIGVCVTAVLQKRRGSIALGGISVWDTDQIMRDIEEIHPGQQAEKNPYGVDRSVFEEEWD